MTYVTGPACHTVPSAGISWLWRQGRGRTGGSGHERARHGHGCGCGRTSGTASYVGPWPPEPLLTSPDVAEDAELADSVSMAMLLVPETLTPTERAVFVLREVFGVEYDEIAEAVGRNPAAVRRFTHRPAPTSPPAGPAQRSPPPRPMPRWRRSGGP